MPIPSLAVLPDLRPLSFPDPGSSNPYVENTQVPYIYRSYTAANSGTNYYVSQATGNDANSGGSTSLAKLTIAAAITAASAGDTINLIDGVFNIGEFTHAKNITVQAYLGARVILDGRQLLSSFTAEGSAWWAALTCAHTAAINTGQANPASGSQTYANTDPAWATDVNCLWAMPVTKNGVLLKAISAAVSTLTRSGTTATCTTAGAHGLSTGDTVSIANVTQSQYNGDFAVTVTGSTTFTYTMGSDPGASGSAVSATMRWTARTLVTSTTYFHDVVKGRLYVGFDPTGVVVKAATKMGLWAVPSGVTATFRGLVMQCYAARYGDASWPAMTVTGGGAIYDNCIWAYSSGAGAFAGGTTGQTVKESDAIYCRCLWAHGSGGANHRYWRCHGRYINYSDKNAQSWDGGAFKFANVTSCTVEQCHVEYCNSPGIWFDYASEGNKVVRNRVHHCTQGGIFFEKNTALVGTHTTASDNLVYDCYWGLVTLGSRYVDFLHNTVWRCGMAFRGFDDSRSPTHNSQGTTITVKNNIFVMANGSDLVGFLNNQLIRVQDDVDDGVNGTTWFSAFNNNAWHYPTDVTLNNVVLWEDGAGANTNYATLAAFTTGTTFEANGVASTSTTQATFLTDPTNGDFRTKAGSAAVGAGATVTTAQRDMVGHCAGLRSTVAPDLGARGYPGWVPQ